MKQEGEQPAAPDKSQPVRWSTGTVLDHYGPVYLALRQQGVSADEADRMDISMVAVMLGVEPTRAAPADDAPVVDRDGKRVAATAPEGIRPPSFWRGNRAAFRSMVAGARELGELPNGREN